MATNFNSSCCRRSAISCVGSPIRPHAQRRRSRAHASHNAAVSAAVAASEAAQAGTEPQLPGDLVDTCAAELQPAFFAIDQLVHGNMRRVRHAFLRHGADKCLAGTMAADAAWAAVDAVVADVMGTEAALLRMSVLSGARRHCAPVLAAHERQFPSLPRRYGLLWCH